MSPGCCVHHLPGCSHKSADHAYDHLTLSAVRVETTRTSIDLPSNRPLGPPLDGPVLTPPGRFYSGAGHVLKIEINQSRHQVLEPLRQIQRATPRAIKRALDKTAFEARDAAVAEIKRVFDRPVPYTQNAVYTQPSRLETMTAIVGLKDQAMSGTPAAKYLQPQMGGGERRQKRFEKWLVYHGIMRANQFAVPGRGAPLDAYGNVRRGLYTQILSALQASPDPMQNETTRSRARRQRRGGYRIFVVRRNGQPIGIGRARGAGDLEMLFFFITNSPRYERRFKFADLVIKTAAREFPRKLDEQIRRELAGLQPRAS